MSSAAVAAPTDARAAAVPSAATMSRPSPAYSKPLACSRVGQVRRLVVRRRHPDVGLTGGRREPDGRLGQTAVEAIRVARPAHGLQAVPERLRVDRVEEQDGVAEVGQPAARDRRAPPPRGPAGDDWSRRRWGTRTRSGGPLQHERRRRRTAGRSSSGWGRPASANQARNRSRVARAVPCSSSSSWTPAMSSPWRVRNSSGSAGNGQSSTSSRPPGRSEAWAAARSDGRASRQLVQRVLEVGQVVAWPPCRARSPWPRGS